MSDDDKTWILVTVLESDGLGQRTDSVCSINMMERTADISSSSSKNKKPVVESEIYSPGYARFYIDLYWVMPGYIYLYHTLQHSKISV